jgi:transposase IS116/IS110/IS902 family protein
LRQIDGQIEAIDRRLKTLRNADSDLCQRFDILTSIPGIGEVTANVLVVETPEHGRLEHAQAASLVGLAPVPRDSGQTHGKRSIRGGRPRARQALYMPALNAIRLNPEFKAKYEAMVKAGKPAKVAIVAIMRKLLILANALIRDQRKWAPPKLDEHGHYRGRRGKDRTPRQSLPSRARNSPHRPSRRSGSGRNGRDPTRDARTGRRPKWPVILSGSQAGAPPGVSGRRKSLRSQSAWRRSGRAPLGSG